MPPLKIYVNGTADVHEVNVRKEDVQSLGNFHTRLRSEANAAQFANKLALTLDGGHAISWPLRWPLEPGSAVLFGDKAGEKLRNVQISQTIRTTVSHQVMTEQSSVYAAEDGREPEHLCFCEFIDNSIEAYRRYLLHRCYQ